MRPISSICCGILALLAISFVVPCSAQNQGAGKIQGVIFNDADLDGMFDQSEKPAVSESVEVYSVDDEGNRTLVVTGKTNENGEYSFEGLPLGRYVVVYTLSSGVTIETLPFTLTEDRPEMFVKPAPVLPKNRTMGFSLLNLGFRNPSNTVGDQVSRFSTDP